MLLFAAACDKHEAPPPAASAPPAEAAPAASPPADEPQVVLDELAADAAAGNARPAREAPPAAKKRRPDPISATGLFDDYGFPALAAVEHLCGKRDYPLSGGHLTWDAFAADTAPAALVVRYEKRLSSAGLSRSGAGGTWRLPVDAATARTLDVLALDAPGPHRACKAKPGPGAKSIIVLSRR